MMPQSEDDTDAEPKQEISNEEQETNEPLDTGSTDIVIGTGLGALAAGGFVLLGGAAVCPLCVIGAPIFLGKGLLAKYKCWRGCKD